MQRIAKEMAFSESTFIFPPERGGDVRMRIFTPGEELPMAGHPTIGSTFALAIEGVIARGRDQFVFELGVGPTPVSLEWGEAGLAFAWMTQPLPTFGAVDRRPRGICRRRRGLDRGPPPGPAGADRVVRRAVSVRPVVTRAAVDAVAIDRKALARCAASAGLGELPVFFFTPERRGDGDETVYSRMLAPGFGIAEDPATGAASGPLGAYLLHHRLVSRRRRAQHAQPAGRRDGTPEPRSHLNRQRRGEDFARAGRRGVRARGTG